MTLIAAFRTRNDGILLCSDRQEDEGVSIKEVEKIYRIRDLPPLEVFVAGAGPSTPLKNACIDIHQSLKRSSDEGMDVLAEYQAIIENCLKNIHKKYSSILKSWPINLIIVVAPRAHGCSPILYQTDGPMLSPETFYLAHGSGKHVADYLAGRLYKHGLTRAWLIVLAAFIFREAGASSPGVGSGTNMILIQEKAKQLELLGPQVVKEVEDGIPSLSDSVLPDWMVHTKLPGWLKDE